MDDLDKLMKKLNKKEKAIMVALFDELWHLKEENEELIDMFVTEKCFAGIKDKVQRKYKRKNVSKPGLPIDETTSTMSLLR
jgi:hypothetical protein